MAAVGRDVEMFTAMAGTLANSTIKATEAGTALRNFMLRLTAATPEAEKTLRRLGVTVRDKTTGDMMNLFGIIDELNAGLDKLGSADRAKALDVIFGKKAIAGASVLLAAGGDQLRAFRDELAASEGANKTLAAAIRDTLMGDLKGLNSAVESVKISVASMNNGPLREAVQRTTDWIRANERLIADKAGGGLLYVMNNLDGIVAKGVTLGKVTAAVFALVTAVKVVTAAVAAFNFVVAAGPIGIMIGLVLALSAALGALAWKFDLFDKLDPVTSKISDAVNAVGDFLGMNTGPLALAGAGPAGGVMTFTKEAYTVPTPYGVSSRMVPDSELYTGAPEEGAPGFIGPVDMRARPLGEAEVIIRDETGRAEIGPNTLENTKIRLKDSWEF